MPMQDEEVSRFLNAWMSVRQMIQAVNFNRFHRAGLSATQFMTLNVVPEGGITLTELARSLNLSAASLKKTVDSLGERGLVVRRPNAADSRKMDILSTRAGRKLRNSASAEFHRFVAGLFRAMPAQERKGLVSGLERMARLGTSAELRRTSRGPSRTAAAAPPGERSSPRSRAR